MRIKLARSSLLDKIYGLGCKSVNSFFDMKFNRVSADQAARSKRRFASR
ncbi:MAG: hypothetical protein ACLVCW_05575 [Campylobacter sp.]